jgi:hypothetical protein
MADVALITDVGQSIITNRLKGTGTEPKYIGYGTGTTAPVVGDTGLETPAAEARTDGTSTQQTTNVANDTYQVAGLIVCADTAKTITEVTLFDAATDGNCYIRGTFNGIPLSVGDGINFTIKSVHDQG